MYVYNPALPAIARSLGETQHIIRNLVIAYIVGYSISQLFYGPLAAKHGRKIVIVYALGLCALANFISYLSFTGWLLWFSRFLAGVGGGACPVIARLIVKDNFHSKQQITRAFSVVTMASAVSAAIAPAIGGYLQSHLDWQATFGFLTVFCIVVLLFVLGLFKDKYIASPSNVPVLARYREVLTNKIFIRYSVMSSMVFALSVGYYTISPFLYQDKLGISAKHNGLFYCIYAFALSVGIAITKHLAIKHAPERCQHVGVISIFVVCCISTLINLCGYFNVYTMIICTLFMGVAVGVAAPVFTALSLHPIKEHVGSATALQGCIKLFGVGVVLALFASVHFTSQLEMSLYFLCISSLVLVMNFYNERHIESIKK